MEKDKKIIIFGCGISGAATARVLAEKNYQVTIYEKLSVIGGNCYDYIDKNGILIHKYGPHILHTSNERVYEFITRFDKLNNYVNKVKVNVNGKFFPLPINFKSIEIIDPKNAPIIIKKIKEKFPSQKTITLDELGNIDDVNVKNLYQFVFANVFANYTAKMWGVGIERVNKDVINRIKVVLSNEENYFPDDKYQGLPINGYTNLIKKMIDHKNIKLVLNSKTKLVPKNNNLYINGKLVPNDTSVIYCGAIDQLFDFKFGKLPFRSLNIIFEQINKEEYQPNAVVNYPADPKMTRITEYKKMTFQKSRVTSISKEFPGEYDPKSKKFSQPFYPIKNKQNDDIINQYLTNASDYKNLYLLGRMAQYKYYDMDDAIDAAFKVVDNI